MSPKHEIKTDQPVLTGQNGLQYPIVKRPGLATGSDSLIDTVVVDPHGGEAYVAIKNPREQALASSIGAYLSAKDPQLARLQFPKIDLEVFEGNQVALVEFFDEHHDDNHHWGENPHMQDLSDPEKAFLIVFNTYVANWDFKAEHVLMPKNPDGKVGLIDFEMSFDFDNPDRLENQMYKIKTVGEYSQQLVDHYLDMFEALGPEDWQAIERLTQQAGFTPEESSALNSMFVERASQVRGELTEVLHGEIRSDPRELPAPIKEIIA